MASITSFSKRKRVAVHSRSIHFSSFYKGKFRMKISLKIKRRVTTFCVAMAFVAGGAISAHAITFAPPNQDLILAIFGGNTEQIINLGNMETLTSSAPTVFNIDPTGLAAVQAGIDSTIGQSLRWSMIGVTQNPANQNFLMKTASTTVAAGVDQSRLAVGLTLNSFFNYLNEIAGIGDAVQATVGNTAIGSFTKTFGIGGDLASGFPGGQILNAGQLGNVLFTNVTTNSLIGDMGQAILSADGTTFTIGNSVVAPVPLPAAGILFATGLLGLVGISRRPKAN